MIFVQITIQVFCVKMFFSVMMAKMMLVTRKDMGETHKARH
ncbi:hypothetical protein C723_3278 [Christiangramia flava JLT2011]|nr:hypothetical protein C723_3278 [Christiangramia flava JLT2011]